MQERTAFLLKYFDHTQVLFNEPMKKHTSFRVGGSAEALFNPTSADDIVLAIKLCKERNIPYFIIGNGSNLLVSDFGISGLVIKISKGFNAVTLTSENVITAMAGALLSEAASFALGNSLKGLEFASGIPGTVGGAVFMNAGAYDGEIKDVIISAEILTPNGDIVTYSKELLELGYRKSKLQTDNGIVLNASFALLPGKYECIKNKMDDLNRKRREKQPLTQPSAGSAFKRPEGYFAAKLIMDSGLSGFSIGGAAISEKHCGFIVNKADAAADDIYKLIKHVQACVNEKFGVWLEPELRMIGNF